MHTTNPVGARLRTTRIQRGHSVIAAANAAGIGPALWRRLEATGHVPRIAQAHLIATYLGTTIPDLWPEVLQGVDQ